jgi:hypothetical protein
LKGIGIVGGGGVFFASGHYSGRNRLATIEGINSEILALGSSTLVVFLWGTFPSEIFFGFCALTVCESSAVGFWFSLVVFFFFLFVRVRLKSDPFMAALKNLS